MDRRKLGMSCDRLKNLLLNCIELVQEETQKEIEEILEDIGMEHEEYRELHDVD